MLLLSKLLDKNMSKLSILHLRKAIGREEFDHLQLSSALSAYKAVDQKINELLKSNEIIRVKKGLYVFGPDSRQAPLVKESLANLIYGPSCISMEYALAFHGLIPERVETITSVTPKRDKAFSTPLGQFTYRYLSATKYPHGITQDWLDEQHPILIASPEKALCDYVALNGVLLNDDEHAASNFLQNDLRIEQDNWRRFDLRKLIQLNKYYRNETIARVVEAL